MDAPTLTDLLEALNIQVVEREAPDTYQVGDIILQTCFQSLFTTAEKDVGHQITATISPFLKNFLVDAEAFWREAKNGRINSGPWVETTPSGVECMFEAIAMRTGGKEFLLIQMSRHAYHEKQDLIQKGRELSLAARELAHREASLLASKADLEQIVRERTEGLREANQRLKAEMAEREQLEMNVRQTSKMESLGTMAGGIAHDFNNILSAVMGYAELAQGLAEPASLQNRYLEGVLQAAERARDLVAQILSFSRQAEKKLVPVIAREIVQEGLKMIRASLPANVEIVAGLHSEAVILADPTQVHQVLMNLCANAGHAMAPSGGRLTVELAGEMLEEPLCRMHGDIPPGAYLRLTIRDTGRGIDARIVERVFDPFFTTKEVGGGTGMGLAVVHGIVKSYRGAIRLESTPAQGTVFDVFLPTVDIAPHRARLDAASLPGGSESILFVDDEPAIAEIVKQYLEPLGYRVTTRTASVDALALFESDPLRFDLVVTDLTMPHMGGDALVSAMRKIRGDIPVILCTGFDPAVEDGQGALLAGDACLKKPILRKELAEALRRVLDAGGDGPAGNAEAV